MAKQIKIDRVISSELEREPKFEDPPLGKEGYVIQLECRAEDSSLVAMVFSPSAALQVASELKQIAELARNESSEQVRQTIDENLKKKGG